jgi:multicomponent K+:H+ antiporter subunit F
MEKPTFSRIVRNNLLLVLAAALVLGLATSFLNEGAIFFFGIFYLGQALVNLILALAHIRRGPDDVGPAPYLLSMLLVLIIGFGACSGIFMIAGGLGNMH